MVLFSELIEEEPQSLDLGVQPKSSQGTTSGQDPSASDPSPSSSGQGHPTIGQHNGTPARVTSTPGRGRKRKRLEDKANVLESLRASQERIPQCQLEMLKEKHNKEIEILDRKQTKKMLRHHYFFIF